MALKEFIVVAVSENRNAFGLKQMVLVAPSDGEAWTVLTNDLHVKPRGAIVRHMIDPERPHYRWWGVQSYECPDRLPDAPPKVRAEARKLDDGYAKKLVADLLSD